MRSGKWDNPNFDFTILKRRQNQSDFAKKSYEPKTQKSIFFQMRITLPLINADTSFFALRKANWMDFIGLLDNWFKNFFQIHTYCQSWPFFFHKQHFFFTWGCWMAEGDETWNGLHALKVDTLNFFGLKDSLNFARISSVSFFFPPVYLVPLLLFHCLLFYFSCLFLVY